MNRREPHQLGRAWRQAYRTDVPNDGELRRAYCRFVARQVRPAPARLSAWLLVGLVLLGSAAFAATGAPLRLFKAAFKPTRTSAAAMQQGATGQSHLAHQNVATVPAPAAPTTKLELPTIAAASAPSSTEPPTKRSVDSGSSGAAVNKGKSANRSAKVASPRANDAWQRAAASLRSKDFAGAELAFRQIELNGSTSERDAARLARAELLLARAEPLAAVNLLRGLSEQAQSPFVRQRARELLQRAEARSHTGE